MVWFVAPAVFVELVETKGVCRPLKECSFRQAQRAGLQAQRAGWQGNEWGKRLNEGGRDCDL
ncbi:hypothetical protein C7N43_01295 [Sphingobacteriales bacterium UPWRP_1]|nr:hypothetical protein B6N25_14680 [Sphingobacteriales bacterium TSM_CSS]PSJ78945.1 hypothetical protein C7N43_01295 [Sphingobacteriales bacterium UPWRP_1]